MLLLNLTGQLITHPGDSLNRREAARNCLELSRPAGSELECGI